jgi:hypothetical protein
MLAARPKIQTLQKLQVGNALEQHQELTPRTKTKIGILSAMLPGTVALLFSCEAAESCDEANIGKGAESAPPPDRSCEEKEPEQDEQLCRKRPVLNRRRHTQTRRRAMVQAARQRKAEISELEQRYLKSYGRLPLTTAEKDQACVRGLYAQYRKMKRFIRDDAACAIQRSVRKHLISSDDRSSVPLSGLKREKRELKCRLKEYDNQFLTIQGRLPSKSEKEPIRNLYERYNEVKKLIVGRAVQTKESIEKEAKENRGVAHERCAKQYHN